MNVHIVFTSHGKFVIIDSDELEKERVWAALSSRNTNHQKWHKTIQEFVSTTLKRGDPSDFPDIYLLENETTLTQDQVEKLLTHDFNNLTLFYKDEPGNGIRKIA